MTVLRPLIVSAGLLSLSACTEFLRWDPPPVRTIVTVSQQGPIERPMQLTPESYGVVKGDTLYSIAFRNNLDFRELAQWNGIGPDYLIVPGQVLRLTSPQTDAAAQNTVVFTPVPAPIAIPIPSPPAAKPPAPPLKSAASDVASAPVTYPSGYQWQWPTAGTVMRGYAPAQGIKGIDFTGKLGQPVFAAAPGRVVYSGNALKGYGELIIIKHDEVHLSAYGYNRKRYVAEGDVVTVGQPIGELGMGPESKPLLHFEIRERGKPVNPTTYLPARPSSG